MEAGWDAAFPPRGGCGVIWLSHVPGRLFARGSHRAAGLTSLAAAGGNILSEFTLEGRYLLARKRVRSECAGDERLPPRRNRRHDLVPQVVATVANVRGRVAHAQEGLAWRGVRACVLWKVRTEELRPRAELF